MSYTARNGRRPIEYASKSSHSHIINDPSIKNFLASCSYPKKLEDIIIPDSMVHKVIDIPNNPIKNVIAIDGGITQIPVKREFPSSLITFYQFGGLYFSISDLENLYIKPFIAPEDMSKLKDIQRYKFVLPTKNIRTDSSESLLESVRKTIYDFFSTAHPSGDKFIDTLRWFIFEEYDKHVESWNLTNCPICGLSNVRLYFNQISSENTFKCPSCNGDIYLTDIFRFHEIVDNEIGAGGIVGYLGSVLEQIVLIHYIKIILQTKPTLLNEILFIKDGQLAFFGQTANLHRPMRDLVNYLSGNYNLYLAGLEKSGAFVEHADEIAKKLKPRTAFLLNNEYIYKYIIPGKGNSDEPYGSTTYYGSKLIYKADDQRLYIITIPTNKITKNPTATDFINLDIILNNIKKLKSDMYDSALIPVCLVNKLVSLSNHPSSVLLEKFARKSVSSV